MMRALPVIVTLLALGACERQPSVTVKPTTTPEPKTEAIRSLVERAAEQSIPAPSLAALDFELPCPLADLDVRRDALIAKAKELGGSAVEGLRDDERQRRIAITLPGKSVAEFRKSANAPVLGSENEKESFDVTLKAP